MRAAFPQPESLDFTPKATRAVRVQIVNGSAVQDAVVLCARSIRSLR